MWLLEKKCKLTRYGLNGGSTLRARRSSQFIWRKNGWALEIQWRQQGFYYFMTTTRFSNRRSRFQRYCIETQMNTLTHCIHTVATQLPADSFTWISAASPGAAPRRNEAFRFSSWKRKGSETQSSCSRGEEWELSKAWSRRKANITHLFQEVPGILREVRRKAEFAFQDFVNRLFSVFSGKRGLWKSSRTQTTVGNSSFRHGITTSCTSFSDETMGLISVHLLLLSACHT